MYLQTSEQNGSRMGGCLVALLIACAILFFLIPSILEGALR
jgi:uncharacterized membrane protein YccC